MSTAINLNIKELEREAREASPDELEARLEAEFYKFLEVNEELSEVIEGSIRELRETAEARKRHLGLVTPSFALARQRF